MNLVQQRGERLTFRAQVRVDLNCSLKKHTNHQTKDQIKREIFASKFKKKVIKEGTTGMGHA